MFFDFVMEVKFFLVVVFLRDIIKFSMVNENFVFLVWIQSREIVRKEELGGIIRGFIDY